MLCFPRKRARKSFFISWLNQNFWKKPSEPNFHSLFPYKGRFYISLYIFSILTRELVNYVKTKSSLSPLYVQHRSYKWLNFLRSWKIMKSSCYFLTFENHMLLNFVAPESSPWIARSFVYILPRAAFMPVAEWSACSRARVTSQSPEHVLHLAFPEKKETCHPRARTANIQHSSWISTPLLSFGVWFHQPCIVMSGFGMAINSVLGNTRRGQRCVKFNVNINIKK